MPRFLRSLTGQLVVLVLAAIIVAQALSLWLFVDERTLALRAAMGLETTVRTANVVQLLEDAPEELRDAILRAASSPLVGFSLGRLPDVDADNQSGAGQVVARLRSLLAADAARDIRAEVHEIDMHRPMPHMRSDMAEMHGRMMGGGMAPMEMGLSIALSDGHWLNVRTRFQRPPLQWNPASAISFGLTAALILIAVLWFLVARITGPLRRLSGAADRLGRGEDVDMLTPTGPVEVQDLTSAFNRMQDRLTRFVAARTRLLAALGHDLRSPLTALRVRAEMVEDPETRSRLIVSIEEMQSMVESTLAFARGAAISEPTETIDIHDFTLQLADDMLESVEVEADTSVLCARMRPNAMRRALRNVLENAVQYGGKAHISTTKVGDMAHIVICDEGPGIPEQDLDKVFEPFLRLEVSRSRETGGTGLGLSIAQTIIQAHGGDITLENRKDRGLAVTITLPMVPANEKIL